MIDYAKKPKPKFWDEFKLGDAIASALLIPVVLIEIGCFYMALGG